MMEHMRESILINLESIGKGLIALSDNIWLNIEHDVRDYGDTT